MKFPIVNFPELRLKNLAEVSKLAEVKQRTKFRESLVKAVQKKESHELRGDFCPSLSRDDFRKIVDGGILTFLLHWYVY
jgi:hypothetical protein